MKYNKDRIGIALVFILHTFLAGCAISPTKDELAALDYGSCPQKHEAIIREHFQGGLLTKYSDELNIWHPQRYWIKKSPFEGGGLDAGYLVPVMADQSFGPQMTAGKQLYGFLFKDDQLLRTVNPMLMQSMGINEAVGPFPKDERNWQEGYSNLNEYPILIEYVLPGETVQNWTELVSVQIISGVPLDMSASKFVATTADQHKSKKPGCAIVSQKILASTPTEVLYEQALAKCAPFRDEYSIRKVIRGPRTLTEVSYSKTSELSVAEKNKWTEIVGKATSLNECQPPP